MFCIWNALYRLLLHASFQTIDMWTELAFAFCWWTGGENACHFQGRSRRMPAKFFGSWESHVRFTKSKFFNAPLNIDDFFLCFFLSIRVFFYPTYSHFFNHFQWTLSCPFLFKLYIHFKKISCRFDYTIKEVQKKEKVFKNLNVLLSHFFALSSFMGISTSSVFSVRVGSHILHFFLLLIPTSSVLSIWALPCLFSSFQLF